MPRKQLTAPPPEPPEWLDAVAADFWREHAARLHADGRLTDADLPAFAALCRYWSKWRSADDEAAKLGVVVRTQANGAARNPFEVQADKCWARVETLLAQFGLTPASRKAKPAALPADEIDALLGGIMP